MNKRTLVLLLLLVSIAVAYVYQRVDSPPVLSARQSIPAPEDVLGFKPGDDRKLASWNQVIEYFERLDRASDRVVFQTLGRSTMDKPFVMATISAPENVARLEEYKTIQEQLADPRKLGSGAVRDRKAAELIRKGKTIVLITCGIHSTEVGSYLSSMLIAHRLASSDEPEIQSILRNTIILLVPSLNPDGVDIVKNWYDKTLGTPYEGTDPPELYHKYTGHDNNRDWYAFTQVETQITVDKIHNVWHPQIVHDIHQQGAMGSRLFLPPYMQPVEPNVPKQIVEGYTELGNWMAREMRAKGFQGITTDSTYDAWSPSRAYSHYHGGVRILSETASAKIATPITLKFEQLTSREGYDPKKESPNFGPLWRGGEWKLRDITNYMTTAAFLLLKHASENREQWLSRFYEIGREAVRPRRQGELWGFVIPGAGPFTRGFPTFTDLRLKLQRAEVEVIQTKKELLIPMSQPYGAYAKALLEPRMYPEQRDAAGHPIAPYDVTAHNLALLYGVNVEPVYKRIKYESTTPVWLGGLIGCRPATGDIALYKSHVPSMDEGWTRWILSAEIESFVSGGANTNRKCGQRVSLVDQEVKKGQLRGKYTHIVIPDQAARVILNGYRQGAMPPELTGGLGAEGVKALREFVEDGGTLVFLNRASEFAIEQFKLPIKNVVAGLPRTDFYVPGSILRIELDTTHPIAQSMPKESIAWAEESPVFEVIEDSATAGQYSVPASAVQVIAWYPRASDPLLSGWLLGGNRIKGKAALIEVKMGKGRIVLFGFRPQYRAQSLATYPLFFNALNGGS
ncbi:MAG TPA: M14 metallopeptidase family protein [Pyrinomonadaceae bacterium]|nr:M14 metallopeptidase family protein [Pyrinomonadaceae bacterium]